MDTILVVTDRETGHIDLVHTLNERMRRDLASLTEDDDQEENLFTPDVWAAVVARDGVDLSRVPVYRYGVHVSGPR